MKLILQLCVPPFQLGDPHFHHVSLGDQCSTRWIIFAGTLHMYNENSDKDSNKKNSNINNSLTTYKIHDS